MGIFKRLRRIAALAAIAGGALASALHEPSLAAAAQGLRSFTIDSVWFHVYDQPEKKRLVVFIGIRPMKLSEMDYLDDIMRMPPPPYDDFLHAAELYLADMPGKCRIERAQKRWEGEHWIDYSCRRKR